MTNSLVLDESLSIPNTIYKFTTRDNNNYESISKLIKEKRIKYIVTLARGSSDCAALFASYIFAKYLGLPTYSMPPSIITLEKSKFDFSDALVIVISQSGLSKDLVECENAARKMGAVTLVISNNENSPIVQNSNNFFNIYAGEEKSVAATKSFVMTLIILIKLIFFCKDQNINSLINKYSDILINDQNNQWDFKVVENKINVGFVISRGIGFALSNEISLKFKELCQELIEPYSSAEVMHGPKSLIENSFKIFSISMNNKSGNTVSTDINKIKKYTNLIYEISYLKDNNPNFFYNTFELPELDVITIMTKFYPWIIRYSIEKGLDPDNPRYLTKVTNTY